ncbi:hypothetical protein CDAR_208191 [Caerostris darwini]|uniref:Uncharacterized protein n=1 Tax=Caerostris darwini TaxID=1538125 RepID=A0AAV4REK0_9ARAC|nr:hypothetical protein CDAR_208191 [Caerostris darwini]
MCKNIRSPRITSVLQLGRNHPSLNHIECSRRIRANCTYTRVPASHLATKKKKAKELSDQLAPEAAQTVTTTPTPALPQKSSIPTPKRKTPPSPDADDEGFKTATSKKDKNG